jgi:hypothetical protein
MERPLFFWRQLRLLLLTGLLGSSAAPHANAFALLGPFSDWMDVTNGFRQPGDMGGPLELNEGYRWNVPTVTYGFDQTFVDYFGSNGVQAVESAFAMLNALPLTSEPRAVLSDFPDSSTRENFLARADGLYDVRSVALSAALEQLGLAQPTRYIFCIRKWDPALFNLSPLAVGVLPDIISYRNFDPITLSATSYVNHTAYGGYIDWQGPSANTNPTDLQVIPFAIDATADEFTAVGDDAILDGRYGPGAFYIGLTYDDAGGLRYLLGTNNIAFESLLPTVHLVPNETGTLVQSALRPGVDKLTFARQPLDSLSGKFTVLTNTYVDTYILNGQVMHQNVERVTSQPDFLFSAGDNGENATWTPWIARSDTSKWSNNSAANNNPGGSGPGVVQPPVTLTFHRLGPVVQTSEPSLQTSLYVQPLSWGSFDRSTNMPVVYPEAPATNSNFVLRFRLFRGASIPNRSYTWHLPVNIGEAAVLQSSTNLSMWESLSTVTNKGAVVEWIHAGTSQSARFFRAIPQP